MRQIVINCYKYHGREDLLPAFSEEDERANAQATAAANVSSGSTNVGVLKMHTSSSTSTNNMNGGGSNHTTHKIQIQASGSPQIMTSSPSSCGQSTAQVCLEPAAYNTDVDVGSPPNHFSKNTFNIFFTFFKIDLRFYFV